MMTLKRLTALLAGLVALVGLVAPAGAAQHKLSKDLKERLKTTSSVELIDVLVMGDARSPGLAELVAAQGGELEAAYDELPVVLARLPAGSVDSLSDAGGVWRVLPDREVRAALDGVSHVQEASAAYLVDSELTSAELAVVRVAVLDSGIDDHHPAFRSSPDKPGKGLGRSDSSVVAHLDFVGLRKKAKKHQKGVDAFGHGTHVAGIITGNGAGSPEATSYAGVSPGLELVDLRVLGPHGEGRVSDVLAAMDWVIANKQEYGIRIVNMSLGGQVIDACAQDPLCLMAERLVAEGLVVVVAAGNTGRGAGGHTVYGSINVPGNAPSVITVGAAVTNDTPCRCDDRVASYSSRGPTLVDGLLKPDLLAPGNLIVSPITQHAVLYRDFPDNRRESLQNAPYFAMCGTSMSTPVVSAAAAILLGHKPNLTPALVKGILMYTAEDVDGLTIVDQGAGLINVHGAYTLADSISDAAIDFVGTPLIVDGIDLATLDSATMVGGMPAEWERGVLYCDGILFADTVMRIDGVRFGEPGAPEQDVVFTSGCIQSQGILLAEDDLVDRDGRLLLEGASLSADGLLHLPLALDDGAGLYADAILYVDTVLWGDSVLAGSAKLLEDVYAERLGDPRSLEASIGATSRDIAARGEAAAFPSVDFLERTSPYWPEPLR